MRSILARPGFILGRQRRSSGQVLSLPDGYYFQFDISDSRTSAGWNLTTKFHDVGINDTTTAEISAITPVRIKVGFLAAKAAGMSIDSLLVALGYAGTPSDGLFWGSNDLVTWTNIPFVLLSAIIDHGDVYSYLTGINYGTGGGAVGPYKYISGILIDTSANARIGIGDLRFRNGGGDVGP